MSLIKLALATALRGSPSARSLISAAIVISLIPLAGARPLDRAIVSPTVQSAAPRKPAERLDHPLVIRPVRNGAAGIRAERPRGPVPAYTWAASPFAARFAPLIHTSVTPLRPASHAPISPPSVAPAPPVEPAGDPQLLLINMDRSSSGLRHLRWSPCLAEVARKNANRIARQGYLSHTDGPDRDLDCGLGPKAGENVAFLSGVPNNGLANSMFMKSPEHRANILGPYQYIGIAWVAGADSNSYIAVEFG